MDLKKKYKEETGKLPIEIGGGYYTDDYVDWLEEQILALRIHDVVGRSEQLLAFKKWEAEKCRLPWDASPEQIVEQYTSQ
jgi:hypothetical protein